MLNAPSNCGARVDEKNASLYEQRKPKEEKKTHLRTVLGLSNEEILIPHYEGTKLTSSLFPVQLSHSRAIIFQRNFPNERHPLATIYIRKEKKDEKRRSRRLQRRWRVLLFFPILTIHRLLYIHVIPFQPFGLKAKFLPRKREKPVLSRSAPEPSDRTAVAYR